jgi:hypothetical protein
MKAIWASFIFCKTMHFLKILSQYLTLNSSLTLQYSPTSALQNSIFLSVGGYPGKHLILMLFIVFFSVQQKCITMLQTVVKLSLLCWNFFFPLLQELKLENLISASHWLKQFIKVFSVQSPWMLLKLGPDEPHSKVQRITNLQVEVAGSNTYMSDLTATMKN